MLLDNFNQMNPTHKMSMVKEFATQVSELRDNRYSYCLYQLFDFYVEIKLMMGRHISKGISGFSAQSSLIDIYIKQIDVAGFIH